MDSISGMIEDFSFDFQAKTEDKEAQDANGNDINPSRLELCLRCRRLELCLRCRNVILLIIFISKFVVAVASSRSVFESCSIEFMYDYLLTSVILSSVLLIVKCCCCIAVMPVLYSENVWLVGVISSSIFLLPIIGTICYVLPMFVLYAQDPQNSVLVYSKFYSNPISPLNCTSEQELGFVELGMALVKVDAFAVLGLIFALLFLCVYGCLFGKVQCNNA